MKNEATMTAYDRWLQADKTKTAFWTEHSQAWSPEVDATYNKLRDESENLFNIYCAEATGKTVAQVAADISEKMHSARD
jgi:hypothetical protein